MPLSTDQIYQDKQRYTQEADSYFRNKYPDIFPPGKNISNFGHNDSIDAFRHAYVSGRFAQDYGPGQSFLFGAYHELTNPNDGPERHMDFWNNSKGIEYSKDAKTPKDLGDRIDRGIKDGELTTEPEKPPFNVHRLLDSSLNEMTAFLTFISLYSISHSYESASNA